MEDNGTDVVFNPSNDQGSEKADINDKVMPENETNVAKDTVDDHVYWQSWHRNTHNREIKDIMNAENENNTVINDNSQQESEEAEQTESSDAQPDADEAFNVFTQHQYSIMTEFQGIIMQAPVIAPDSGGYIQATDDKNDLNIINIG